MFRFEDVIGHENLIEHLQSAIAMKKISHAYIFDGEKGAGKNFLADIFAATLQCENQGTEPCGTCTSCKQAEGKPCVFPEKKISCMSAYCIDVGKLAKNCELPFAWSNEKMHLFGLIACHETV